MSTAEMLRPYGGAQGAAGAAGAAAGRRQGGVGLRAAARPSWATARSSMVRASALTPSCVLIALCAALVARHCCCCVQFMFSPPPLPLSFSRAIASRLPVKLPPSFHDTHPRSLYSLIVCLSACLPACLPVWRSIWRSLCLCAFACARACSGRACLCLCLCACVRVCVRVCVCARARISTSLPPPTRFSRARSLLFCLSLFPPFSLCVCVVLVMYSRSTVACIGSVGFIVEHLPLSLSLSLVRIKILSLLSGRERPRR